MVVGEQCHRNMRRIGVPLLYRSADSEISTSGLIRAERRGDQVQLGDEQLAWHICQCALLCMGWFWFKVTLKVRIPGLFQNYMLFQVGMLGSLSSGRHFAPVIQQSCL